MGNHVLIPQPMGTYFPAWKMARPPEAMHPWLGGLRSLYSLLGDVDFPFCFLWLMVV